MRAVSRGINENWRGWSLLGLAALLLAPAGPVNARAEESGGPEVVTSIEGISEFRLENGLRVLLFPDASRPTVTVNMTVFVGSRHEGYGEAGMAHLLEHMLFKGTPAHPNIPRALQSRGASFNGTTWVDRTNYYETLPATDENLEFAIRLEADRLVNSLIREEDLASEMTVVRNEFEQGENMPSYVLSQRMLSAAYDWHNYGRSTIGNRADIERVPIENLRTFYRRYYQPDNVMLVVAGRFDPERALDLIQESFGPIPRPERALSNTYTEEPPQDGERLVTLRRVGDVALAGAVYHIPAGAHPEFPAVDVLESILTMAPAGRLYQAMVETKKAANVSGAAFAWHDPGVLRIMAEVSQGNEPEAVLAAMLDELDRVARDGVTEEEVERARQRLLRERELAASDSTRIAIELSEWAAMGDWRLYFLYRDRLEEVTAEDVSAVASRYLRRNNRTVGLFLPTRQPERATIPRTPDLAEMIGDYQGRDEVAAGEAFDASPANIEDRTERLVLSTGVMAALLPRKTRGEAVHLRLTLRYGDEQNLRGLAKAAELLPQLMARGTERLTRQQLQDALDRYRAQLRASGSPGEAVFSIETRRDQLPHVLGLLAQVLREPALPEHELDTLKRAQLASLERRLTDPQALATTTARRHITPWPQGDPRYVPTLEEEIEAVKALDLETMERIYREFLGGTHGELVILGDFDRDAALAAVEEMLAGWEPQQSYARLKQAAGDADGGARQIVTPDKENAVYFAAMALPIRDDHPDYPALVLGDFILGGGSLSSRLGDRVRQQEGLSYGVGTGFNASPLDPRAAFYIFAISNPENMARLTQVIEEEVDRLLEHGITEEELAEAKEGYLQNLAVARADASRLTGILAETVHARRTMQHYADLEAKISRVSAEQVVDALQKHLDPNRLFIVTAGDFPEESADSAKP